MHKSWSVRTYLGLLGLAVALPCALVLGYSILSTRSHEVRQVQATTLNLAQLVASHAQQYLTDAEKLSARLAQRPLIRAFNPEQRDAIFDQFSELYPQYANLLVCDLSGKVLHSAARVSADLPLAALRSDWLDPLAQQGRFTISKPIMGQVTRRWVCLLGQPVYDSAGRLVGALGIAVDLARFQISVSPVQLPNDSTITIMDKAGVILMRSTASQNWIGKRANESEAGRIILREKEGNVIARGVDDEERIYGFTTIPRMDWHVFAGIPTSFALAGTRMNTWRASLVAVVLLALVLALVLYVARLINQPIRSLSFATVAAAEGRLTDPVPVTGPREIAAVADEFNRMLAGRRQKEAQIERLNAELEQRVKERTAELEKANFELERQVVVRREAQEALRLHRKELQDYIDSMSTLNAKIALDGSLLLVNRSAQQASGLTQEALLKTKFLEGPWCTYDPEVHERLRAAFANACAGASINYDEKLFVFGKITDVNVTLIPVPDPGGSVAYIMAEGREITQRKKAEAALAERTRQLETANKELEAFSYSVSHDLRAPLRGIDGFTKALIEDYGAQLDDDGRSYLQRVRSSTVRMSQLIDDLLKLSRVSRGQLRWEQVDLSVLAVEIAQTLQQAAPERPVRFLAQPALTAGGDARLLRVVLENLLSNAWKFARHTPEPRIDFGCETINGSAAYFVRDNGAGFDMAYAQKLFGAFQRLHSTDEYEGTGIGLATVQRIIHRHGGRVWARGETNRGATFYFSLGPLAPLPPAQGGGSLS